MRCGACDEDVATGDACRGHIEECPMEPDRECRVHPERRLDYVDPSAEVAGSATDPTTPPTPHQHAETTEQTDSPDKP